MRKLLPFFGLALLSALMAGCYLQPLRLFAITQPLTVCLSIMVAAIFVRLNRGMPSLDWKSIDPEDRKGITERIEQLTWDYVIGLAITAGSILYLMVLLGIGPQDFSNFTERSRSYLVGGFAMISASSLIWMGYVVWRDFDIVRLQRAILDEASDKEFVESQSKQAEEKLAAVKSATIGFR